VDTPGAAYDVAVVGSYAYVADNLSGLQVIDVSNPAIPVVMGGLDTPDAARGVAVVGDYAYVADGISGLQVVPAQCSATGIDEPGPRDVPDSVMLTILSLSPNPFSPPTEISFESRRSSHVTMDIYDVCGRRVRTVPLGALGPGLHWTRWDGRDGSGDTVPSGVYFVRLSGSDGQSRAVKSVLVR
jgi:hypothetical protein